MCLVWHTQVHGCLFFPCCLLKLSCNKIFFMISVSWPFRGMAWIQIISKYIYIHLYSSSLKIPYSDIKVTSKNYGQGKILFFTFFISFVFIHPRIAFSHSPASAVMELEKCVWGSCYVFGPVSSVFDLQLHFASCIFIMELKLPMILVSTHSRLHGL